MKSKKKVFKVNKEKKIFNNFKRLEFKVNFIGQNQRFKLYLSFMFRGQILNNIWEIKLENRSQGVEILLQN